MFSIGYRTVKTAIGAALALAIAQWMDLDFYVSAAIITILCISITKKSSLRLSWQRFAACMLGLFLSFSLFELLGYHPLTLGLLLLVFIPLAVRLGLKEGIVTSVVIILHIYTLKTISISIFINEIFLITIGIGIALIMNMYIPSVEGEVKKLQAQIEGNFKIILNEIANYLKNPNSIWDGKEITETVVFLKKAQDLSLKNIENHVLRYEDKYYNYFKMREKQFEIIERILPFVSSLDDTVIQGLKIAEFLESLSEAVARENNTNYFLNKLNEMRREFESMLLPQTRKEFEIRSSLFYVMTELEQYLYIKDSLKHK